MDAGAGVVRHPVIQTPEENRRISDSLPKGIYLPVELIEDWIHSLGLSENDGDVRDVIDSMRSYLP